MTAMGIGGKRIKKDKPFRYRIKYLAKIKDIPRDERPRERLTKLGAESLSLAELLALIIRTGTKDDKSAIDIANSLVKKYKGNLSRLLSASVTELSQTPGIGSAKAAEIKACLEIARRLSRESIEEKKKISSPEDIFHLYSPQLNQAKKEYFMGIFLDTKNKIIKEETISVGSLNASIIHPREVLKTALLESAASIILVHNHPSGESKPSEEDLQITQRIDQAAKIMGIELIDHVVIGNNEYFSFKEKGMI